MDKIIDIIFLSDEIDFENKRSPIQDYRLYFTSVGLSLHIVSSVFEFDSIINCLPSGTRYRVWIHLVSNKEHHGFFKIGQTFGNSLKTKFSKLKFHYLTTGTPPKPDIDGIKVLDVIQLSSDRDIFLSIAENINIKDDDNSLPLKVILTESIEMGQKKEYFEFAVIAALYDKEYESLKKIVDFRNAIQIAPHIEGLKTLKKAKLIDSNKFILIDFQSDMGMVDATSISTLIMSHFEVKYLLMVGVCGGRESKGVDLTDLIIPDQIVEYQTGKYENGIFKPYLKGLPIENKVIIDNFGKIKHSMIVKATEEEKDEDDKPKLNLCSKLKYHYKSLACGNIVVKTDGFLDGEIAKYDEEIMGVEMESFGVARACELMGRKTKPIIIKGVMDFCDSKKTDKKKSEASFLAAQFAYFLMKDDYLK